jgi:hypothetical protein
MSAPERIQVEAQSDGEIGCCGRTNRFRRCKCGAVGRSPARLPFPNCANWSAKRGFGLKLARPIIAQDGQETIRAWIEVTPQEGGCLIILRHWQAAAYRRNRPIWPTAASPRLTGRWPN